MHAEQNIFVSYRMHVSSCHGGEFEGNSCKRLMKDGDLIFKDAKQYLLQRLDFHLLGNDNFAIERDEIEDSCHKHSKLCVLFDGVFSAFYAKRGECAIAMHHKLGKDLDHMKLC